MPKYRVSILAQVGKTITVEADDTETAEELAHELFDPTTYDGDEYYTQDTYEIREEDDPPAAQE